MTARKPISTMQRMKVFEAEHGLCHLCGQKIFGKEWDVSHDRPLALLGEDGGANLKVAHRECHRAHTAEQDAPRIAKARRQAAKHVGATVAGKPMAGSRASGWRHRMNGKWERRNPV